MPARTSAPNQETPLSSPSIALRILSTLFLFWLSAGRVVADPAADVEQILRVIRQDQPVPSLHYLRRAESINAACAYFRGQYRAIDITVETRPHSDSVASILLQIPGADQTQQILPAVSRVLGPPHASDPKQSTYGWAWPTYRTASVHYAPGGGGQAGFTVVSIFER
ncbi:hypothetical protein [uncultured Thiocystis sp.]|jgi:hypothetical protein|uniref:hypothetical protein n=1 Tax=uncultured Thiocystis sp. TaxID=1202134 RepID=UPI0025D141D5|nr:hypothetical protein [uncultured Thiocystis sp.]